MPMGSESIPGQDENGLETEYVRALLCAPDFDWDNDRPLDLPDEDIIAYSLHVRGYTKSQGSKVKIEELLEALLKKFRI